MSFIEFRQDWEKENTVHLIVIPKYLDNARYYRFRLNSTDIEAANGG